MDIGKFATKSMSSKLRAINGLKARPEADGSLCERDCTRQRAKGARGL